MLIPKVMDVTDGSLGLWQHSGLRFSFSWRNDIKAAVEKATVKFCRPSEQHT
jgi:hypothetical protein